ncbi:hypothetical protein FRC08_009379 [Ceratobasidium sp. 394]|nr:hypothetical protein FRC08_009379 [Ceratobasidium sp. 394]
MVYSIDPRLNEFVAFLQCPPSQHHFFEFSDILSGIFPTHSIARKRRAHAAALRSAAFLSNHVSPEDLKWLPEHLFDMAPRATHNPSDSEGHGDRDVSGLDGSNSSSHSVLPGATSDRVRASGEHHQSDEVQPDDHIELSDNMNTSPTNYPPESYSNSDASRHEYTSASRHEHAPASHHEHASASRHEYASAPRHEYASTSASSHGQEHTANPDNNMVARSDGPRSSHYRLPPIETGPPSAYQTSTASGFARPTAPTPPSTGATSARPSGAHHASTATHSSSSRSASAVSHERSTIPASSNSSVPSSAPSSAFMRNQNPNASNAGQGPPRAPLHSGSTRPPSWSSAASRPCGASIDRPAPTGDTVRFAPPLTGADYVEPSSMPPPPPPPPPTRGATSHNQSRSAPTATQARGFGPGYSHNPLNYNYGPNNRRERDGNTGVQGYSNRMPDEGQEAAAGAPPPLEVLEFLGLVVSQFSRLSGARRSLQTHLGDVAASREALVPGPAAMRIFNQVSARYYQGLREPRFLREQFRNLHNIFREIGEFGRHFSLDFTQYEDEDELLQTLQDQLKELAARGIRFKHLTPWKIVVFIRQHWYHWMRVAIGGHPNMATGTDLHNGVMTRFRA